MYTIYSREMRQPYNYFVKTPHIVIKEEFDTLCVAKAKS
jgi:hypothetical protein